MKLAACLRALAQMAESLPEDLRWNSPYLGVVTRSLRLHLFFEREDVEALYQQATIIKELLVQEGRLSKVLIEMLLTRAVEGKREEFYYTDALEFGRNVENSDRTRRGLKRAGFRVTNHGRDMMRVRWW